MRKVLILITALAIIVSFVVNVACAELTCPNCNTVLDNEAKFCYQCGKLVANKFCSYCGFELPDGANFCSFCGNAVSLVDNAKKADEQANSTDFQDAEKLASVGFDLYTNGQYEAAACFYKLAAYYDPSNYEYIHSAMVSSFDAGDSYSVLELIKKLIVLQPNNVEPYLELQMVYEENPLLYPTEVITILGDGYLRTKDQRLAGYNPQKEDSSGNNTDMSMSAEDSDIVNSSSSEAQITNIQEKLVAIGLLKVNDTNGVYSNNTIDAVKTFQNWVNQVKGASILNVTGGCDALTLAYLDYAEAHDMQITFPTEAPTSKSSVGKPAITIGSSVYQADGITYINDSTVIFSWMADGQIDSYIVSLTYEDGTEYSLGSTTDTSKTLSTDQLQPGRYKLFVGAKPVGGSDEDIMTSEFRFAIPQPSVTMPAQEMTVNSDSASLPVYIPTSTPDITEGMPMVSGILSANGTLTEKEIVSVTPETTELPTLITEPEQTNQSVVNKITCLDENSPADQIQTAQMALYSYGLLNSDSANPGKLDSATLQAFALFQQKLNEQYGMNLYVIDPDVDSSIDAITMDCLLQQNLVLN